MIRIFLFGIFLFTCFQISSQTCCSGGIPLSNNLGLPNDGKGSFLIGLNYDYNNLNTLNAGSNKLSDDSRLRITNSVLLNAGYAFTDRFSFEGLFTWIHQKRTITQFGNENLSETQGVGDAVFLIKYAIPDVLGARSVLNLGLGTKAPLGKSNLTTTEGFQLTADLQPGSGAWDMLGWLSLSKNLNFRPSATLSGSFTYRATGKNNSYLNNTSIYKFGNVIQSSVGYSDQFLIFNTIFNPSVILKYRKSFLDKIDTSNIPNTGGEWIFVRPELGFQITPNISFNTRIEIPVYSYVDGTQLTPTVRFSTGFAYSFKKKTILKTIN